MQRPNAHGPMALRLAGAVMVALLAHAPTAAQQGEPIGSWWLTHDSSRKPVIMTPSTQGSGVIALQCDGGKSMVVIGVRQSKLSLEGGISVAVEYQIGAGERQRVQAQRVLGDVFELNDPAASEFMDAAGRASFFTVYVPHHATSAELTLVFRPVETKQALDRLREACAGRSR
jgi:hypothetical protein